jgi:hypothetical protein
VSLRTRALESEEEAREGCELVFFVLPKPWRIFLFSSSKHGGLSLFSFSKDDGLWVWLQPTTYIMPCVLWLLVKKPKPSHWTFWFCYLTLPITIALMILGSIGQPPPRPSFPTVT